MSVQEIIKALPKVEQHVHIIGSVYPDTLLWLNQHSDNKLPYLTSEELEEFYVYKDFSNFLDVYSAVNDLITHEKHYELITYEMLQNQHISNVRHVECIFSAYDHMHRGLDFHDMIYYINRAIRRANRDFKISCNIRIDLVRNYGPKIGQLVLDQIRSNHDNIVAIDTGGSEYGIRPSTYAKVYENARDMGLRLVAHQGEASNVEYVWECINYLKPDRIGHAVAGANDQELLSKMARKGISIETCPISNLKTGAVKSLKEHPIKKFIEAGIKVSVNTDDPPMFDTDMNNEYLLLHSVLGFSIDDLFNISIDSIQTSFLEGYEKRILSKKFVDEYNNIF